MQLFCIASQAQHSQIKEKKRSAAGYDYPQQTARKDGVGDGIWTRDFQDHNLAL